MRVVALAACLVVIACGPPARPNEDGLGSDTGAPTGTEFKLPTGVALQGTMYGGQTDPCMDVAPRGHGNYVEVCFSLSNTTTSTVQVTLPGGLIFVAGSTTIQNGLLVQEQTISLPPNTTTAVYLYLFCLNAHRDPSWYEDVFSFGPVTDHPGLQEIVRILKTRTIDSEDEVDLVQWAVWEVTDDLGRMSGETRTALEGI